MYRLYGSLGTWKLLDKTNEESEVIGTISDYVNDTPEMQFMIIQEIDNTDIPYRKIRNIFEYALYVEEYNSRQNDKKKKLKI